MPFYDILSVKTCSPKMFPGAKGTFLFWINPWELWDFQGTADEPAERCNSNCLVIIITVTCLTIVAFGGIYPFIRHFKLEILCLLTGLSPDMLSINETVCGIVWRRWNDPGPLEWLPVVCLLVFKGKQQLIHFTEALRNHLNPASIWMLSVIIFLVPWQTELLKLHFTLCLNKGNL